MQIYTYLKTKFLAWLLLSKIVTIGELHSSSNPVQVAIPDTTGDLKFIEQGTTDLLVLAEVGYIPIKSTFKTVPYQAFKLELDNGLSLVGADEHLIINSSDDARPLNQLQLGEEIKTELGLSRVRSVTDLASQETMYDLEVDHPNRVYYTNGILSHNTTVIAAYLLWFACFKFEKYVLVASKDNDAAIDVMDRIRYGYEELPMWLKPGCLYFNRHEIVFDNKSTIKSSGTTENTGRGRAISLLMLDELAFVAREIQRAMWTSLAPTLATGGQCIISSTPNGDQDLFAELWRGANTNEGHVGENGFFPVRVEWDEHPERDENYRQKMIARLTLEKWNQEFESVKGDTILSISHNGQIKDVTFEQLVKLLNESLSITRQI